MPISPLFTSIHTKEFEIYFSQCAPNEQLKYTELCNIFQLVAAEHAEVGGISFTDMQAFNQAWVMSKMRIEVNQLPKWRDLITVKTWIVSLENSRSVRAMEMYLGDTKLAGCESFWAVFNTQTRRPEALNLPHDHFERFENLHPTVERVKKVPIIKNGLLIGNRKIYLSDLDVVNHVNNVKYLEWCLDFVKDIDVLTSTFKTLDMNYLRELTLNNEVEIFQENNDGFKNFSIKNEGNLCFSLQIGF